MNKNLSGSLSGVIDEMLEGSIAGNISFSSGGGSNVTITPTLTEGTKIADYTINGSKGVLYAPTPTEYEAGDNVTIKDGVISATDTTYTAGDNITIENGVISASGGSGINYSTDEQVIGTWIDGSPLYRKVFTGLDITPQYNSWTIVGDIPVNVDKYIGTDVLFYEGPNGNLDLSHSGLEITFSNSEGKIKIEYNQDVNVRPISTISILYTKITNV